jgi:4'-phosphopantetheinyl transferase EntD
MDGMLIEVSWSGEGAGGLASVLPRGFGTAVCVGSPSPEPLFPSEAALVSAAVDPRRAEFARGPSPPRQAMALLGVPAAPILATPERAPMWPAGLVGSISHASEYCCAAMGWAEDWAGVGVDVEVLQPIDCELERNILSPAERSALERLDGRIPWACVVFSIKEAMYKLWNPLMECWLDFHDALVRLDPDARRFEVSVIGQPAPSVPPALRRMAGRFDIVGRHVVSAIALPRGQV